MSALQPPRLVNRKKCVEKTCMDFIRIFFSAGSKKKKRRSGRGNDREKERSASPQEIPIDPDEPTYCLCDQVKAI